MFGAMDAQRELLNVAITELERRRQLRERIELNTKLVRSCSRIFLGRIARSKSSLTAPSPLYRWRAPTLQGKFGLTAKDGEVNHMPLEVVVEQVEPLLDRFAHILENYRVRPDVSAGR